MAEKSFRFARNLSWNMLGQVAVAALNFFFTPILVTKLGPETYGLYIILHAVVSYLMLSSMGAGTATIKYVAESKAAGDQRALKDAFRYSLSMHAVGTMLASFLLALWARVILVRVFHVDGPHAELGVFVLRCAAAGAFFASLVQSATSVLTGLQRFEWTSLVSVVQNGLMAMVAAALLGAGLGLRGVASWYVALNAGVSVLALAAAWRLLGVKERSPRGKSIPFKDFASWSLRQWLGPIAWIVSNQFDKLFIVRSESLTALTLYSVPAGLLQRVQSLYGIVSVVIIPMMSPLKDRDSEDALRWMYLKSVRLLLWLFLPVFTLLFAVMPQFLTLWLGPEFAGKSVWPARYLVLTQVFCLLTVMPNTAAFSRRPLFIPAMAWAQALLSLLAWKLLIPRYELLGAALGSLAAQALPACVYVAVAHRQLIKLSFADYVKDGLYAPGVSAALMLAVVFPFHAQAVDWVGLLALAGCGYLVYYGSTWFLLNRSDRELLVKFLRWEKLPAKA